MTADEAIQLARQLLDGRDEFDVAQELVTLDYQAFIRGMNEQMAIIRGIYGTDWQEA